MLRYVIINMTMNFVFHSSEIFVGIEDCDDRIEEDCNEVCEEDGVTVKLCAGVDDNRRCADNLPTAAGCPAFTIRFSINEDTAGSMNVHNYYNSCFYTYLFV